DVDALRAALAALVEHHDALRMRFEQTDGAWHQHNAAVEAVGLLERHDLSAAEAGEQRVAMEDVAARTHAGFDLGGGPLIKAVLFDLGASRRPVLLLAVHHLVVDGVSWRILLEDLEVAYRQASGGQAIHLPAKTTSFRDWALRLVDHVASGGLDDQLGWWAELGDGAAALPRDREGANTIASTRALAVHLDPDETRALLSDVPGVYRTQINDVLLAALGRALCRFGGSDRVLVDLEGHGREDVLPGVDLSRTVGWFTTLFPVALDLAGDGGWASTLKSVKEQLRAVPGRGLGYGALRYLREGIPGAEGLAGGPEAEVSFNYLGQFDWTSAGGEGLVGDGRAVEDIYPLTPMQAGMLFHGLSQAEQGVYFEQASFVVEGVHDPLLLGQAFQQVVDRTPVLRTRVVWEGVAEPVQVVEREAILPVRYLDWSELSETERHRELGALLERDRAEGLDLASAPLARLVLARLS